jgi:hypothetical protein
VSDYRRQFAVLESLPGDVLLASHGSFFNLTEKRKTHRFVDRNEYRKFVAEMKAAFEATTR